MKKVKMLIVVATVLVANVVSAVNLTNATLVPVSKINIPASMKLAADTLKLDNMNGKYVLLQYWAKKAEGSLKRCIEMDNTVRTSKNKKVEMVMVSFDPMFFADSEVKNDELYNEAYRTYALNNSINNYLLDENGAIVARNINPEELAMYIKKIK